MFHVTIDNEKNTEMHAFDPRAPEIKNMHDDENTCVFNTLDFILFDVNEYVAEHAVLSQLSSSLSCDTVGFINKIKFSSDIVTDRVINKG